MSRRMIPADILEKETQYKELLKNNDPYDESVENLLNGLRQTMVSRIIDDLHFAHAAELDNFLWMRIHYPIIESYRKVLKKMHPVAKKRPTEARKLENSFVKFIKGSSKFYRTYIQELATEFGIKDLDIILTKFRMQRNLNSKVPSKESYFLVVKSCHRALVCLGDLSRYREMHSLGNTVMDWRPATNYYNIAKQLFASSGFPHNQLAVIAVCDGSVLSSTYHFYRAMCVKEPFPTAQDNLVLGFKKFLKNRDSLKDQKSNNRDESEVHELLESFLMWHAGVFTEVGILSDEGLEMNILHLLRKDLKDRKLTADILIKIVLINISAHYILSKDKERVALAKQIFLFNICVISNLLKLLNEELEPIRKSDISSNDSSANGVPAVVRRVLYGLRIYSAWIVANIESIVRQSDSFDYKASVLISDMWLDYAEALSTVAVMFGDLGLEKTDILLKEDMDLIGYEPLSGGFYGIRSQSYDLSFAETEILASRLHPSEETLLRISDLLTDAVRLSNMNDVPLVFEEAHFTYVSRRGNGTHNNAPNATSDHSVSHMMSAMVDSLVQDSYSSYNANSADDKDEQILFTGRSQSRPGRASTGTPSTQKESSIYSQWPQSRETLSFDMLNSQQPLMYPQQEIDASVKSIHLYNPTGLQSTPSPFRTGNGIATTRRPASTNIPGENLARTPPIDRAIISVVDDTEKPNKPFNALRLPGGSSNQQDGDKVPYSIGSMRSSHATHTPFIPPQLRQSVTRNKSNSNINPMTDNQLTNVQNNKWYGKQPSQQNHREVFPSFMDFDLGDRDFAPISTMNKQVSR
ncbi:hypothetical protein V1511DRAFT_490571 [Dipodascopsis uninucleata]